MFKLPDLNFDFDFDFIVISALTSALHVYKGVIFRLSTTVLSVYFVSKHHLRSCKDLVSIALLLLWFLYVPPIAKVIHFEIPGCDLF